MSPIRRNPPARGRMRLARAVILAIAVFGLASLMGASSARADIKPAGKPVVLSRIGITPVGRLVRISFEGSAPLDRFALSRQGPPNKRDLVLTLPNAVSGLSEEEASSAAGESEVPYEVSVTTNEGISTLKVIMDRAGDSLVRLDNEGGRIGILLIPQEKGRVQSADAYYIGPDDVLAVSVFGHDDLTKTMKVSPDGLINFPLIGNVHAAERTVDQVAAEIQERLAENFLVDPHVTVSVWEYLSQWVNVIGEVAKPGRYYMTGPMTLIDAISQAGGVKPTAGDAISVTRRPQESDPAVAGEVMRFSSSSLLSQESSAAGFRIRPGDVIQVLPSELIYVSGAVRSPGPYPLGRGTTLTRAIDLAGGLTSDAQPSQVELVRVDGNEKRRLSFDIREIETSRVDDPVLRPGDEVVVRRRS